MDWTALRLSAYLALATALVLIPLGVFVGRWLATSTHPLKPFAEAALALPLVLPPTVLGYYLLVSMGGASPLGALFQQWTGGTLAFSFAGLLLASLIFNIPFAMMPIQRAFEAIPQELFDAARTCGLSRWRTLWHIELPLAWRGILSGLIMTAAHIGNLCATRTTEKHFHLYACCGFGASIALPALVAGWELVRPCLAGPCGRGG